MESVEQAENSTEHLKPWQFKPGQSGNPKGRPKGSSLKEHARQMLSRMTPEEREEFMKGIDKKTIWEMAEGKPEATQDITSGGEPLKAINVIKSDSEHSANE